MHLLSVQSSYFAEHRSRDYVDLLLTPQVLSTEAFTLYYNLGKQAAHATKTDSRRIDFKDLTDTQTIYVEHALVVHFKQSCRQPTTWNFGVHRNTHTQTDLSALFAI